MSSHLGVEIAGLQLANPTMVASGILGLSAPMMKKLVEGGAGAIVTKSVGLKPRKGYPNPTTVQVDCGIINAMGLPNPGVNRFADEIGRLSKVGVPIIVSVYGFSPQEFADVAEIAVKAGADAVELNVSCPHVEKTGAEIGQFPDLVKQAVKKVKARVEKAVFAKLTPNVTDITEVARAAAEAGADAITAINTVKSMVINVETTRPVLANKIGGLSGAAIKPIALRCVYEIYKEVTIPIIGCGGITSWRDAVEFMLAGSSAVQIGTSIATEGTAIFKSVIKGVEAYLEEKKIERVKEIVGKAHLH
jgi:dihydroorotate dehydrogenase (NAD+) catalytic subunit